MAGSATKFSEADKAKVFVALTSNDGNVKRTTRDTGVPESTVRRWKNEWKQSGPPDQGALEVAVDEFYDRAEEVRFLALDKIEAKLKDPHDKSTMSALIAVVGVLDDKIARVKGIGTSSKVEHQLVLPTAEEFRQVMQGFLRTGLEAAQQRDEEIIEAEVVEQVPKGSLPPGPTRR